MGCVPTVPAAVLPHEMDSCPVGSPCRLPLSLLGTGDDVGSGHTGRPEAGFTVNLKQLLLVCRVDFLPCPVLDSPPRLPSCLLVLVNRLALVSRLPTNLTTVWALFAPACQVSVLLTLRVTPRIPRRWFLVRR